MNVHIVTILFLLVILASLDFVLLVVINTKMIELKIFFKLLISANIDKSCVPWNFFDYVALSLRFQKILLELLSKELGKSFDKVKNFLYRVYSKGFYVYAEPKKFKDLKSGVEYAIEKNIICILK